MKRLVWLALIVLGLTACGRATTASPTVTTALPVAGPDMAGINLEVHQEPG